MIRCVRRAGRSDGLAGGHPGGVLPRDAGEPSSTRLLALGERLSGRVLRPTPGHRAVRADDRQLRDPRRLRARPAARLRRDAVRRLRP